MATPTDLLDRPAVMSYSGLVDASTAEGQAEEAADWADAIGASAEVATARAAAVTAAGTRPVRHLAQITKRRGAYSPAR